MNYTEVYENLIQESEKLKRRLILDEQATHYEIRNTIPTTKREIERIELLISAVEKEMPATPLENLNWCDLSEDERKENSQWFCKKCCVDISENQQYCFDCGKKIDWS